MPGLDTYRLLPFKAQPAEILQQGRTPFGAATCCIDILNPQQEIALAGLLYGLPRSINMAQMQMAGGAGGKTGDDSHGERLSWHAVETNA
ncbi:Hypothetical protein GbCGDNIH3_7167 [Granulibacter bethesdensis]|uniref:Uncharacterized protein n=1 Tax=Granulibacter bethesdensis TaxID=364410 RepID=A0AAN0VFF8_9PROT|nr:Hypothetical protein GbCGDNIH3_7167 [Granulibacter bethesdensis]AHJ65127.1 Hypothetical protein GbCGDNIH4_7061 [Granulibacter bethesdensis CGDNIH4]